MVLHTLNKEAVLQSCLQLASDGDTLLFIEDGVCSLLAGSAAAGLLEGHLDRLSIKALAPDVTARGLDGKLIEAVTLITDANFVTLTVSHQKTISWF